MMAEAMVLVEWRWWMTVVACVGLAASAASAALLWMVFVHPVMLAEMLGGVR